MIKSRSPDDETPDFTLQALFSLTGIRDLLRLPARSGCRSRPQLVAALKPGVTNMKEACKMQARIRRLHVKSSPQPDGWGLYTEGDVCASQTQKQSCPAGLETFEGSAERKYNETGG